MNIREIIREELQKVFEVGSDYYNRTPDFFDPLHNPNVAYYPPVGMHSFGDMVQEDEEVEDEDEETVPTKSNGSKLAMKDDKGNTLGR